jgi:hypothetical protein
MSNVTHSLVLETGATKAAAVEAIDDLARAAMPGVWTYPGFVLIFILTTDYLEKRPRLIVAFGILNLMFSAARLLLRWFDGRMKNRGTWCVDLPGAPPDWSPASVGESSTAQTIVLFGIDSWTFLVVTICVAGICAAVRPCLLPTCRRCEVS